MKYLLLIHHEERAWAGLPEAERQRIYAEYGTFMQNMKASGQHLDGFELQPSSTATTVRIRDGKRLVTDGPFAETREQLGGYFLVEAADLDAAIDIASRIPSAAMGTIEIRPVVAPGSQAVRLGQASGLGAQGSGRSQASAGNLVSRESP
jgi:hypothetical protein